MKEGCDSYSLLQGAEETWFTTRAHDLPDEGLLFLDDAVAQLSCTYIVQRCPTLRFGPLFVF